jgi:hypothetical protein
MDGACSMRGEIRHLYRMLVGVHDEKVQVVRPRRRWNDNIKIMLKDRL